MVAETLAATTGDIAHPCSGSDLAHAARVGLPHTPTHTPRTACSPKNLRWSCTSPLMHKCDYKQWVSFRASIHAYLGYLDYLPSRQPADGTSRLSHNAHAIRFWHARVRPRGDHLVHYQIRNRSRHALCEVVVARCDEAD